MPYQDRTIQREHEYLGRDIIERKQRELEKQKDEAAKRHEKLKAALGESYVRDDVPVKLIEKDVESLLEAVKRIKPDGKFADALEESHARETANMKDLTRALAEMTAKEDETSRRIQDLRSRFDPELIAADDEALSIAMVVASDREGSLLRTNHVVPTMRRWINRVNALDQSRRDAFKVMTNANLS